MNATVYGISAAILGTPRAAQTVHDVWASFAAGRDPRFVVLVVPHGDQVGAYFEVSKRGRDRLIAGMTPDELGLDELDPTEVDGEV